MQSRGAKDAAVHPSAGLCHNTLRELLSADPHVGSSCLVQSLHGCSWKMSLDVSFGVTDPHWCFGSERDGNKMGIAAAHPHWGSRPAQLGDLGADGAALTSNHRMGQSRTTGESPPGAPQEAKQHSAVRNQRC